MSRAEDIIEYRQRVRQLWQQAAPGWQSHRDSFRKATMPVSIAMINAIDPQPGDQILELAAGIGDTGFLAAELIAPGGTLICSDFMPEMLSAAQERAQELGITNVRFRQIDAESIDIEAASLDGVLCRWGYMLMPDPLAALQETRRVLKPGRRVALATWTAESENPWAAIAREELLARELVPPLIPGMPGMFAWASPRRSQTLSAIPGFPIPRSRV